MGKLFNIKKNCEICGLPVNIEYYQQHLLQDHGIHYAESIKMFKPIKNIEKEETRQLLVEDEEDPICQELKIEQNQNNKRKKTD